MGLTADHVLVVPPLILTSLSSHPPWLNRWLKRSKMPLGQLNHLGNTGQALVTEQNLDETLNHCL